MAASSETNFVLKLEHGDQLTEDCGEDEDVEGEGDDDDEPLMSGNGCIDRTFDDAELIETWRSLLPEWQAKQHSSTTTTTPGVLVTGLAPTLSSLSAVIANTLVTASVVAGGGNGSGIHSLAYSMTSSPPLANSTSYSYSSSNSVNVQPTLRQSPSSPPSSSPLSSTPQLPPLPQPVQVPAPHHQQQPQEQSQQQQLHHAPASTSWTNGPCLSSLGVMFTRRLRKLIHRGVPDALRAIVWQLLAGSLANEAVLHDTYRKLIIQVSSLSQNMPIAPQTTLLTDRAILYFFFFPSYLVARTNQTAL
ncbi:unnamed protein product [Protopolystoma xenopodis]|uniref:Rab-GAP TBC domain-containing protein n=1 Tax=Protopolystoma xenopodis TaxID=117903 RepID=A0A3S5CKD3_9PLAT|nr:unnamed protein product [Protopolystoma xenopodis]